MFGIDLDQPGPDDIAAVRDLLERVGYDASGMSDAEALEILRGLLTRQPREDRWPRRAAEETQAQPHRRAFSPPGTAHRLRVVLAPRR